MLRTFLALSLAALALGLTGCEALDYRNVDDQSAIPWNQPRPEEKELDLNPTFNW
ncbi:hypothetical protein J6U76_05265 [bacterium]|jgi:hypothetical protein|nr:hypothetical protein [bacterium]